MRDHGERHCEHGRTIEPPATDTAQWKGANAQRSAATNEARTEGPQAGELSDRSDRI